MKIHEIKKNLKNIRFSLRSVSLQWILKRFFSEAKVELGNVVAQLPVAADETGSDFVDRDAAVKVFEQLFEELVSL